MREVINRTCHTFQKEAKNGLECFSYGYCFNFFTTKKEEKEYDGDGFYNNNNHNKEDNKNYRTKYGKASDKNDKFINEIHNNDKENF